MVKSNCRNLRRQLIFEIGGKEWVGFGRVYKLCKGLRCFR